MFEKSEELLKRPLYVFDLPPELLVTLQLTTVSQQESAELKLPPDDTGTDAAHQVKAEDVPTSKSATSCLLCSASFSVVHEQRRHVKSDWHNYNLKQKLRGGSSITEAEFEKLVEDLDESISGSESSESEDEADQKESTLTALLRKQAKIGHADAEAGDHIPKKKKRGSGKPPLIWLSTPLLQSNVSLGVYRALFTESELEEESKITDFLRQKQLSSISSKIISTDSSNGVPLPSTMTSPQIFLCMIGGGHFAGMIVSLAPKIGKKSTGVEERQAIVIAHKTFHRYTTRRKQGGSQSANDSAKGAAHSAGASIRRYNEGALEIEIRALLKDWKGLILESQLVFVRATGSANRRILFGPYDGQVLRHNDPRNRSFPFSTRRATQAELMRAFVELTRMKVSRIDEAALAAAAAAESEREAMSTKPHSVPSKLAPPRLSKEEEESSLHTSQLQALIRRSKVPAILAYLATHSLAPDFKFFPPSTKINHHAPTPLHLAASSNSPAVVIALLTKVSADPTTLNGEGHPPFDLAGDRSTRDAFRVARFELGDERWDWRAAHCPPPLSKADADRRQERERAEADKEETERRKAETDRLKKESAAAAAAMDETAKSKGKKGSNSGKGLGAGEKTGAERREEEARGLTPEMRTKLERERRARAAEERMRRMAGGGGAG
ncbi:hypothetical protein MMC07_004148 [Pseudocyphellaria aurata]|nr:hypothetical protein [Pseudocyphellaria aurata]